jgi:hypothetical protein
MGGTWRRVLLLLSALAFGAACSGGGEQLVDRIDRLGKYDRCLREDLDGCLVVNYSFRGKGLSHMNLAQDGEPVDQYGLSPSIHMAPGDGFSRPLRSGNYEMLIFRKPAKPSRDEPTCRRPVHIRVRTAHFYRVTYTEDDGCRIELRGG